MTSVIRVEWTAVQGIEMFLMIAERSASDEWTFFSRSSWELRWYPMPSSAAHVERANQLSAAATPAAA
jgi:hypothetical protein